MIPVGVLAACLVVILTTVVLVVLRSRRSLVSSSSSRKGALKQRAPTVIIAGPTNSGKTALFNALTTEQTTNELTVMSQEPSYVLRYDRTSTTLIEFPGHIKLAYKLLDHLKELGGNLKGLVFVVDATKDPKDITDTAEFLTNILLAIERTREPVDILIACNKSESFTARQPAKIKQALEAEITKVLERRKKSLINVENSMLDENDENEALNLNFDISKGFKFEHLEGELDIQAGSVLKGNTDSWYEWIKEHLV
ncbi:Signal recognition particle receptor subunit beta [Nakaseomyces bracarensis]|uniref:Signal recognition particle receptor subunit beta n=1 Tax=Nakaseomyces bracarensis TaxID=273131 RepID=A0ABR4NSC6_9SACH